MSTAALSAVLTFVVALGLAGCAGGDPVAPPRTETTTTEPIFASDEEALAAAEVAVEAYLSTTDAIASGSEPVSRLEDVSSGRELSQTTELLQDLSEEGLRIEGQTRADTFDLIERFELNGLATVSIYFCVDVSETRLVDTAGNDATRDTRRDRTPYSGTLTSSGADNQLLVESSEPWTGADFC